MPSLPLEGIRVLELAEGWAGPLAGEHLADLGAEVVKMESISRMDHTRGPVRPPPSVLSSSGPSYPNNEPGEHPWNRCHTFIEANRNKLSVTIDLTRPGGLSVFYGLATTSDVFLTNTLLGSLKKLGITYEALREARPDIIMLASSGFGATGPYADCVSMGGSVDALAGHTWLRGYEDGDLSEVSSSVQLDATGGLCGAFSVIMALHYRARTGRGQLIDLSQTEGFIGHIGEAVMDYTMNGRVRASIGNGHPFLAPYGCYPCRGDDNWIAVSVCSDEEWQALVKVMGSPQWATDGNRFGTGRRRWQQRKELDALLARWTAAQEAREIMAKLQAAGVAAGAVNNNKTIYEDPHFQARGFFQRVSHRDAGTYPLPGVAWKMSKTPGSIRRPAPLLGEHNRYAYTELLGFSEDLYRELEAEDYLGETPRDIPV